jgi:hypothetical protein
VDPVALHKSFAAAVVRFKVAIDGDPTLQARAYERAAKFFSVVKFV